LNDLRRVKNPLEEPPPCTCISPPLNVNVANGYGFTSLHIAARQHDLVLVNLFLKKKKKKKNEIKRKLYFVNLIDVMDVSRPERSHIYLKKKHRTWCGIY
jgi:ankyrin repeat protein